jgi:hypothetical protein
MCRLPRKLLYWKKKERLADRIGVTGTFVTDKAAQLNVRQQKEFPGRGGDDVRVHGTQSNTRAHRATGVPLLSCRLVPWFCIRSVGRQPSATLRSPWCMWT